MSRTANSPAQARPTRTPLNSRQRLSVRNREAGYVYRIVNANLEDDPDRVARFMEAGYELVPKDKGGSVGDAKVDNPTSLGSASEISVGQGTKAVLMRIREDWYKEDQAAKQREIDEIERTMKQGKADYGTFTQEVKSSG